jgi:hypothetical protein
MRRTTQDQFLAAIRRGDIGLNCSNNLFSTLQDWYRRKVDKVEYRASHGFIVKDSPYISEANGPIIKQATITKFIGNTTKCWVFRYKESTPSQIKTMMTYCYSAEKNGGTYSAKGIFQFATNYFASFFGKKVNFKDQQGTFCTEYSGNAILYSGWPYIKEKESQAISPSYQLSWLMSDEAISLGWELVAHYDGEGGFFVKNSFR